MSDSGENGEPAGGWRIRLPAVDFSAPAECRNELGATPLVMVDMRRFGSASQEEVFE